MAKQVANKKQDVFKSFRKNLEAQPFTLLITLFRLHLNLFFQLSTNRCFFLNYTWNLAIAYVVVEEWQLISMGLVLS